MSDESDLHAILVSLSPAVIAFLKQRGFFELVGPYGPADILPLGLQSAEWAAFMRAARAKNTRVWEILKRRIPDDILEGATQVAEDYGLVKPKSVKAYADMYIRKHGGELIRNMTRVDQKAVVDFIWSNAGRNERPFAREIMNQKHIRGILDTGKHRTKTIIRTERGRAISNGSMNFAKDNGAKTKTRHSAMKKTSRKEHMAMNGQTRKIDEPYSNSEMYCREKTVNCLCWDTFNF